jgi:2-polyprenyl-3-methyl-5-hydroxy-6-metoxy-1,4-benzoquinol methylase
MPSREYHESLWEQVPLGIEPVHASVREQFLLDTIAAMGSSTTTTTTASTADAVRVLDVGCGDGHFAAVMRRAGAEVVALDVAEEPLRRARALCPGLDARLVDSEAEWPLQDSSFDLVWAGETIEHVVDTASWLSEVRRVLRSHGVLLLSTPDNGPLSMLALVLRPRALETHFDPRSDHLRFYTRRTLESLLEDFGFEDVAVRAVGGPPWAQRSLLARASRRRF